MIIIFLAINVIGKFSYPQFNQEQEISLYPTVGEFYQYQMGLESDSQLKCKMHPEVPNVEFINQCEKIYQTKGNQFKSMSSNSTHFGTLTNKNEVIIYEWKNSMIQQFGQSVPIDPLFNCFNINLSLEFQILVDCYYNNEFLLIQLKDSQSAMAYSIISSSPTQTKMQSILNGTNAFLVYAQYFQKYTILSLISSQFLNLSSLNQTFVDFDIPITISPNIYPITSNIIFQYTISPDSKFLYKTKMTMHGSSSFNTISAYYNLWSCSQCDQLQISYFQAQSNQIWTGSLFGCESEIKQVVLNEFTISAKPILKILQSNQFIINQYTDQMQIREQNTQQDYFYYLLQNQKNSLLYLNSDNELFSFNQEIEVYKISYPFLEINLTTNENVEQNHPFQLICLSEGQQQRIYNYYNFFLQVLPQNDTNIQIMFNQDFQQYQTLFNYYSYTQFNSFSGQLLNYRPNYNETYLNFQFLTFSKVGEILQIYQLVQLLSIIQTQQQYLIGYGNNTLNLLLCNQKNSTQLQYCQTLDSISFSQNVSSLQVAFSLYPPKILIGLSSNDTIYLFQYQNNSNSSMTQSNYTFEQQFSDFVLTYNSIIVLIQHQEIQILAFNNQNNYTLNQQSINKLFNSIQFNPLQIIVNSQFQSSFLYINNVNDVIIISIDQNSLPIPITTIGVNFTIELINLVSQQLILSLICNNQQNICFQIWNVQQLPKYYYVKNLPSVNFDNNIIIQSDNLFFYVTFSNQTVYVYNPQLSYHMSLYYVLQLNSSIQGSQYLGLQKNSQIEMSLIISNNSLFILSDIQVVNLTIQQQIQTFNNSISYPQFIYNYTITSQLNDTAFQQTPNQSMALYSNFTVLQNLTNISVSITSENIIPESKNFTFPMNLILDRQIGQCYLNNSYDQNKFCQLTQISHQYYNISNIQNYSLITSINNEIFALQNISYIQTVNSDLTPQFSLDYSYLNLSVCDQSTSSNYTLYSICYNDTQFYLLNFTLSQQGNITNLNIIKMPQNFTSFYQMSSILNQFFIVGQEDSKIMYLYWLNQSSNTFQNISNGCQGFSIKQLKQNTFEDIQSQQILIYYVYMSQVNYTIMTIDDQGIKLQNSVTVQLYYCNQQSICFKDNQQQYFGILIIEIELNSVIILVSNINFSCIVITRIIKSKFKNQNTQVGRIYRTIPKYGPYRNTLNSFYQNGVLMQQFSSKNLYYFNIGVYYLNNLLDENLLEPILMQGLIYSKNSYAMVVNQEQQSVTTVYIYNNFIYSYTFSTSWNVSCLLYSDIIYVPIFCQNNFSNGTYLVTFNLPPHFRINFGPSEYSLLAIIFLLLLYFYIRFTQRTKTLEDINSEIEL